MTDKTPSQYATGRNTAANMVAMSPAEAAAYDRGVAAERQRIRVLAVEHNAQCSHADGSGGAFADLLDGAT